MSIVSNIVGDKTVMNDQTIANEMLIGAKTSATMYLNAALECATPELKSMYSSNLNQILSGHSAATELAVTRKWYRPYEKPEQQLADAYKQSVSVVELAGSR
ncbi:MAG: spore coat protein [Bacillota bacterium]|nr:spore coat protein [Bacillota bacterium]